MEYETWLGQILIDGVWTDYARGHEAASRQWQEEDPTERRVVDWIHKDKILVAAEVLTCLNESEECAGRVEYRTALSGTGQPFPRCDHHWDLRLAEQDRINRMYPDQQPEDFDPSYAGESWYEDE